VLAIRHRSPDLSPEVLDRRLERRQLQVPLAAEEAEEAALSHLDLVGQAADRQPIEPLDRGPVDRGLGHRGAGLGDGCG
jgi:hypothetical protein